jgi:elongation factor 1-gamma
MYLNYKVKDIAYNKIIIASKYSKAEIEENEVENIDDGFKKKFPTAKLPTFESSEGVCLFGSNAIMKFIALKNKEFVGETPTQQACVDQWVEFFSTMQHDLSELVNWLYGQAKKKPAKGVLQEIDKTLENYHNILNTVLLRSTYIAGDRLTIADIAGVCLLLKIYEKYVNDDFKNKFKSVKRWYTTIMAQEKVKEGLGLVVKEEKKTQNPISAFNLEVWKRKFMNSEAKEAIEYFWGHLDKKINTVWIGEYKYAKELKETFKTRNLMGGYVQRMQPYSKVLFGILLLCGTEESHTIKIMWLFEREEDMNDLPKFARESDDFELYNWTKMDFEKEEDRKKIDKYLACEGKYDGLELLEEKTFR